MQSEARMVTCGRVGEGWSGGGEREERRWKGGRREVARQVGH